MSDDELEKLAAAMKNISPSKAARKSGMEAAMAAFDVEFAAETIVVTEAAEEKISTTSQGLSDAPRPTGQTTFAGNVGALGRDAMSKVKEFFTAPKAMMMMGTCAAALFATSLYIPNTRFEDMPKPAPQTVTAEVGVSDGEGTVKVAEADEVAVRGQRVETLEGVAQQESAEIRVVEIPSSPAPVATPKETAADKPAKSVEVKPEVQSGINSINGLLNTAKTDSARVEADNKDREAKFRQRKNAQSALLAQPPQQSENAVGQSGDMLMRTTAPAQYKTVTKNGVKQRILVGPAQEPWKPQINSSHTLIRNQGRPTISIDEFSTAAPRTRTKIDNGYVFEEVPAEYKTEKKTIVTKEASVE